MAQVLPFKAIRPAADKVHLVASRSVDGYNSSELKEKLAGNPFTFLHIINPDFADGIRTKPGSPERLKKTRKRFESFLQEQILIQDAKEAYYLYRQIKNEDTFIGIIACTSIDDYINGVIKVHEQTLTQREEKLKEYLEVCEFNAEPVLFCYPNNAEIDNATQQIIKNNPSCDFTTTDRIRHTLWIIDEPKTISLIKKSFENIPAVYIADGHHRSASSTLLGKTKRKQQPNYSGKEAFNFYLGVFFPESQLRIYDYNRVVKDLNRLSESAFLDILSEKFEVKKLNDANFKPQQIHEIGMYLNGSWYKITIPEAMYNNNHPVDSLDADILTRHILDPILNIRDLKTDKRIGFVPGIKGSEALKKSVDEGKYSIAFSLYPVTMQHLKWIADTNQIMPPKSTWVEPKMRSGLVIYSLQGNL